jgi:hypothetical protein
VEVTHRDVLLRLFSHNPFQQVHICWANGSNRNSN